MSFHTLDDSGWFCSCGQPVKAAVEVEEKFEKLSFGTGLHRSSNFVQALPEPRVVITFTCREHGKVDVVSRTSGAAAHELVMENHLESRRRLHEANERRRLAGIEAMLEIRSRIQGVPTSGTA